MSKFKFDIDPKEPREDQVARHKDFGKVLQNYQRMTHPLYRTPLYRYRKIFIAVFLSLLVVWLVSEFGENKHEEKNIPSDTIKKDSARKLLRENR
ncbi:MAG: hypothetical protein ABIQ40_11115 [Bacteroidia bacterium]